MSTTPDAAAPPTHVAFSLAIPASWQELELRPALRDRSIAALVDQRLAETPQLKPRRADMIVYLRDLARQSWDVGSRYCGAFIEVADDGIVPGSITVTILPPAPSSGGNPLESVVEQLASADAASGEQYWAQTTMVTLKHAGRAVRHFGVQPVRVVPNQAPIPCVIMHTFVPFEGGVALIAGGSPAADLDGPLLELFDAVTDNFRIHAPEQG